MTFTMMVGLPGSGKTTLAKTLGGVYLSSDEIREELYGDAACQENPGAVFDLMLRRAMNALDEDKDVVYDATNINRNQRKHTIDCLRHKYPQMVVKMIVMAVPIGECISNDKNRDRVVGNKVIMKMAKRFHMPLPDEYDELKVVQGSMLISSDELFWPMVDYDQKNPHHERTLDQHCLVASEAAAGEDEPQVITEALFFHDCGKVYTQSFKDDEVAHYYGHGELGSYLILCSDLLNNLMYIEVAQLVCYHMRPYFSNWEKGFEPHFVEALKTMNKYDRYAH